MYHIMLRLLLVAELTGYSVSQDGIEHSLPLPHFPPQPQLSTRAQEHTASCINTGGGVKGWEGNRNEKNTHVVGTKPFFS